MYRFARLNTCLTLYLTLFAALALSACGKSPPQANPDPERINIEEFAHRIQLEPATSCEDVVTAIKEAAITEMTQQVENSRQQYLNLSQHYADGMSRGGGPCYGLEGNYDSSDSATGGSAAPAQRSGEISTKSSATEYSETNNQVAGVDEADIVKNDGKHIYLANGNHFRIIDAWPPEQARIVAEVELKGQARKLFVHGDRALVFTAIDASQPQTYDAIAGSSSGAPMSKPLRSSPSYGHSECTYGYGCDFVGDGRATHLLLFDISDRASPKLVRQIRTSGSLIASRRIGDAVFTVLSDPAIRLPQLSYYPSNLGSYDRCGMLSGLPDEDEINEAFDQLIAENRKTIEDATFQDWFPMIHESREGGRFVSQVDANCADYYRATIDAGLQTTTVLTTKLSEDRGTQLAHILSRPGAVYASAESLFVSVPHERTERWSWLDYESEIKQLSTVHRFSLDAEGGSAAYQASGLVKGRVLNQFAMDEHDGHLRIATSSGHVPDPDVHSTLTVLKQRGRVLKQTGGIDRIAPQEDIRSVRFDGARGFVVTFKKTDPLFVFDLSDPAEPEVLAELKIPGFSTYMHLMDEDHLLTIGYDADDQGSFAYFTGVQLQIFDISDPEQPKRTHSEIIGTRGSSSEALTNHLAFNYFGPKQLLALPMTICEGEEGQLWGAQPTFSGLLVYRATHELGFQPWGSGRLSFDAESEHGGAHCGNWWTNASSVVRRSIVMDDYIFALADDALKIAHLADLSTPVKQIPFVE